MHFGILLEFKGEKLPKIWFHLSRFGRNSQSKEFHKVGGFIPLNQDETWAYRDDSKVDNMIIMWDTATARRRVAFGSNVQNHAQKTLWAFIVGTQYELY